MRQFKPPWFCLHVDRIGFGVTMVAIMIQSQLQVSTYALFGNRCLGTCAGAKVMAWAMEPIEDAPRLVTVLLLPCSLGIMIGCYGKNMAVQGHTKESPAKALHSFEMLLC